MSVRRVVTGLDESGAGMFVSDVALDEVPVSNTLLSSVWRSDGGNLRIPPAIEVDDGFGFPVAGGTWVLAWSIPPRSVAGEQGSSSSPTKAGEMPTGGAHSTDSIDINVVTAGQAIFQLEDGSEKVLNGGDSIVVNGVSHTWHNRLDEPVQILSLILGAERLTP